MNRNLRLSIILIASSFAIGVSYGVWQTHQKKKLLARTAPLRVLCNEKWLDNASLEKISEKLGFPIQLFTYSRPIELVRQMANTDGKIDVICVSSFLSNSLIQSHWLKQIDLNKIPNAKLISVDFTHLAYDPDANHTVPLFWNLYGFFGKGKETPTTYKQALQNKSLSVWNDSLNLLYLLTTSGVDIVSRLEIEQDNKLESDIKHFIASLGHMFTPNNLPINAEAALTHSDWIQLPLAQVSRLLGDSSPYHFSLPADGGFLELGLLAVGEKSERPTQALQLINELIAPDHALSVHKRLGAGVVHPILAHLDSVAPLQRPEAIRQFPLNRLKMPELKIEAIPRFQKVYDSVVSSDRN